jgi:hypothetical protein
MRCLYIDDVPIIPLIIFLTTETQLKEEIKLEKVIRSTTGVWKGVEWRELKEVSFICNVP